ncbi:hypothetical protein XU18_4368 [Perkinsela sp. CCAP 1560/4]|nr:hypothetical protein XU18_4368 [Perkinsela sp. CCAP 1560/4]|eukprot:KNH04361.1 hypothetical protein XU18_4368 [Perkinsela sp. CCAP 1560/4]
MSETPDPVADTRNTLFASGLMSESYVYVKKKLAKDPENIDLMALAGQTAYEYEKTKNPILRTHWCDRLDLLHEALETTHRCMEKDPDALQCARYFVLLAVKAADMQFFIKELNNLGVMHNWHRIHARGEELLEKNFFPDVALALAGMHGRVARRWYNPFRFLQRYVYGIPTEDELYSKAIELHTKVLEHDPENMENVCRLGQVCLLKGDDAAARKWFSKVRNEMVQREKNDQIWAAIANTALVGRFPVHDKGIKKSHKWRLPLG